MQAQVYDSTTGAATGDQFTIGVRDHAYQAFKPYPDGSAAYPAAGASTTSIKIARVLPLTSSAARRGRTPGHEWAIRVSSRQSSTTEAADPAKANQNGAVTPKCVASTPPMAAPTTRPP